MLSRTAIPWRDPVSAFAPLRDEAFALLLQGAGTGWSYICANPSRTLTVEAANDISFLEEARAIAATAEFHRPPDAPPFCGGWAGLLSYEFGRTLLPYLEAGPCREGWPDIALGFYPEFIAFDHDKRHAEYWRWDWGQPAGRSLLYRIETPCPMAWKGALCAATPEARVKRSQYESAVARVVDYIFAGDCFQANLSQRFDFSLKSGAHPYDLVSRLASRSPAPFASYLRLQDKALVSNSPERFVKVRGGQNGGLEAVTQPIKGTRPRGRTPAEDLAQAEELLTSEKDRAENLMIVDLMRNDLSRVARAGTVKVPQLNRLETYANVHHLVSTVEASLQKGKDGLDVIQAAFPGGSVTGAPKIRSMQIIAKLEQEARGPYCGSLLWLTPDGWMDSSILIRSVAMQTEDQRMWQGHFRSGGGIVSDSVPAAEYQETMDKAAALMRALTEENPEPCNIVFVGEERQQKPVLSPEDRSFLLGDGCFETLRSIDSMLEGTDQHLELLRNSMALLEIEGIPSDDVLKAVLSELASGLAGEAALRITVSRGAGGRGAGMKPAKPLTVLSASPLPEARPYRPLRVMTSSIRRNETSPLSRIKSTSYGESLAARREAIAAGMDEALLLNTSERVACLAMGNLFLKTPEGVWVTPPESEGIRPGYMRGKVLNELHRRNVPAEIRQIGVPELAQPGIALYGANSLWGLRPVCELDGNQLEVSDPPV